MDSLMTDAEDRVHTTKGRLKSRGREQVGTAIPAYRAISKP